MSYGKLESFIYDIRCVWYYKCDYGSVADVISSLFFLLHLIKTNHLINICMHLLVAYLVNIYFTISNMLFDHSLKYFQ